MKGRPHLTSIALTVLFFCAVGLCVEPPAEGRAAPVAQGGGSGRVAVLIGFRHTPGPSEQALVRTQAGVIKYSYHLVPAIAASIPEQARAALLANSAVTRIEVDGTVTAFDAELDSAWGVKRIGAGLVHDALNKGAGVKVAIIDTGIDRTHPDLDANYKGGKDFVNGDDDPMDDHGHGTHVAGIIAAEDDGAGVVGVAPEAWLYALKILDSSGSGSDSDMIAAMEWAVDNHMDVVNLSLGTPTDPGTLVQQAFDDAASAGIVTVAAAGNRNWIYILFGLEMPVQWPAAYESVIAVSAMTSADAWASFSCSGPEVELAAPGDSIYSTIPGGYAVMSGTSMAAPHVTGTAALVIAAGYSNVRARLADTADDFGTSGRDPYYGCGLVDADEAAGGATPPANQAPTASFTYETAYLSCSFDASGSSDPDGDALTYAWNFGDGSSGGGVDPSHTYAIGATYSVTLTVTDEHGATAATSQDVTVNAPPNQPPTASFTYTTDNLSCSFDASGSSDADGSIVIYAWDFGDGGVAIGATANHTYGSAATYTVTLAVMDDDGATDSLSKSVTVTAVPVATMHVGDIMLTREKLPAKKGAASYRVTATVLVVDASGAPVSGATVNGDWGGWHTGSVSAVTVGGTATFTTGLLAAPKGSTFTFAVTSVTKPDWEYDASANVETSDSIIVR
jgi:subtilisin